MGEGELAGAIVVAAIVALIVVAIFATLGFVLIGNRTTKLLYCVGAGAFVLVATALAFPFMIWALYNPHGPPGFGEWSGFIAGNAIAGSVAGIPGGGLGMVIGHLIARRSAAKTAAPSSEP